MNQSSKYKFILNICLLFLRIILIIIMFFVITILCPIEYFFKLGRKFDLSLTEFNKLRVKMKNFIQIKKNQ
jgi:hypothetical protein